MMKMLLLFALLLFSPQLYYSKATLKDYIIDVHPQMNVELADEKDIQAYYYSFLPKTVAHIGETRMIHTYFHAMSGFAARLTENEVNEMAKKKGFLRARPSRVLSLLTTHSPDFLGLQIGSGLWKSSEMGKGIIIGLFDSGIMPKHISFNDHGMPPPPSKWKGNCNDLKPSDGSCNNKLIGARDFTGINETAIDNIGHGTHTAATAAGNFVANASVLGNANGTASGMAPLAHLAIYKVCSEISCLEYNIVAGMDAAISDGVDVISLSLGSPKPEPFDMDGIAISSFHAANKGIFVSCAAGNQGPKVSSVTNVAPWVLTVAASTMDRSIKAIVKLGDGQEFEGQTLFQPHEFSSALLPLAYPIVPKPVDNNCKYGDLRNIKGKIVLCHINLHDRTDSGHSVQEAGGAAVILMNVETVGYTTFADAHVLPASHVSYADSTKILSYFNSSTNVNATIIFKGTIIGKSEPLTVAAFSSRGPNALYPGILKPDILGPGVNILSAWLGLVGSPSHGPTNEGFNIISGTSMSTPHLSGIAALVKQRHPDWTPAAIKSAIMTTSMAEDRDGKPIKNEQLHPADFFAMGAGHVNPSKVADPGLVFDIDKKEYIGFLCSLDYTDEQVYIITGDNVQCSKIHNISQSELNYPAIVFARKQCVTVNRTVTNVGEAMSSYKVKIDMPDEVIVKVVPTVLEFNKLNEKKSYMVSIVKSNDVLKKRIHGNLRWVSDKYIVRTPIVIVDHY